MFYCKFCGFFSRDSCAVSCGNRICREYTAVKPQNHSPPMRPTTPPMMPAVYPPDNSTLAFATVPFQRMTGKFLPEDKWLRLGTIFPELSMTYPRKIFDRNT